jgi:hypothetical protein
MCACFLGAPSLPSSTSQLNPYVKLTMKKQGASPDDEPAVHERRTRVIGGGNTAPKWNQEVVFDIDCYQKTLSLACYDEDLLDDDEAIGTVEVDLTEALNHQGETIEKTVILQDENVANRGEVPARHLLSTTPHHGTELCLAVLLSVLLCCCLLTSVAVADSTWSAIRGCP